MVTPSEMALLGTPIDSPELCLAPKDPLLETLL